MHFLWYSNLKSNTMFFFWGQLSKNAHIFVRLGGIIKMWKLLWNLAKKPVKNPSPKKGKQNPFFSLLATAFVWCFWKALFITSKAKRQKERRGDFVFCELDDKYVSISCCCHSHKMRAREREKVSAGIVVADNWRSHKFPSDLC